MLKLKKIAVTGGLSAGKTTVCQLFEKQGAYVISADEIVHQLLSPGTGISQQVIRLFGSDIVQGGQLDRQKIAAKAFSQPDLLQSLEKIVHPAVFNEIEQRYRQACQSEQYTLFIAEIPLLYESEGEKRFDAVIAVVSTPEQCRLRFAQKTHQPEEEFDKRMLRQLDPAHKAAHANYKIDNNGTLQQLETQVEKLYSQITQD